MALGKTLMSLLVKLGVDTAELDTGLAGAETKAKSSAGAIGASMKSVGASMQKTGAVMSAAITAPIVAAGVSMVDAASDLEETRSKVGVVFGDMAGDIEAFAKSAATDLGMTQEAAMAAAGTYGNLFVSMGIGVKPAADMSQGLVQLAADLASFNNMDPAMVLDKLRAGLTGETEPLKTLGVNLTAASIQAKAMEMGLADASGELSASAKAQASYALILEQTTTAQGDFARTSDGLANQQRILKAQFGDMAAELGEKLLPIALQLVEGLSNLLDWFTNLPEPVMNTILVVAGLVAALGPVLAVVGTVVSGIGSLVTVFGGMGGAVTAVSTFLTATLIPAITAAGAAIAPVIVSILPIILILAAIAGAVYLVYKAWTENWGGIQDKTMEFIDRIVEAFNFLKSRLEEWGLSTFIEQIFTLYEDGSSLLGAFFEKLGMGEEAAQKFAAAILGPFQKIVDAAGYLKEKIAGWGIEKLFTIFEDGSTLLEGFFERLGMGEEMSRLFSTTIIHAVDTVKSVFAAFRAAFEGDWRGFGEALRDVWDNAWETIRGIFEMAWTNLKGVAQRIVDGIKAVFAIDWGAVGRSIIDGIVNALVGGIGKIVDAARNVAEAALDTAKGFLGIDSPSKVFGWVGKMAVEGFANALENTGPVNLAMDRFNAAVATPMIQPIAAQAAMGGGANQPATQALNLNFNQQVSNGIDLEMVTNHIIDKIREMRR